MRPELHFVPLGELRIAVWEWAGVGPPLLFAHATGFHGRCWDQIVQLCPGRRALALDFRGHGRSSIPAPPIPWPDFSLDLLAIARHFDLRETTVVGHSMGGHAAVLAAIRDPRLFAGLVLVDPVLFPPEYYGAPPPDAAYIARRRNRWASADEMYERFHSRPPFSKWRPEVLKDYCDYALLPEGDSYVLACPPELEASIYARCNAPENNLDADIPSMETPVILLRAGRTPAAATLDLNASPTAPDLARKFRHAREIYLPDGSHYIPMETPDLVARALGYF